MKLSDLQQQWQADCKMDEMALDAESLKIPNLHSKYLALWNEERLNLRRHTQDYKNFYRLKWEYYSGKLSDEDLEEQGWEQFHLKILRQDLDIYLQGDKQLGEFQQKIDYTKQKVDYLENIIKQLNGRGYLIKNAIDFMRFQTGA
tara:strand:+ start:333 stop:767 length:435 start_codon:yes stop_codon:yes gene_type:complete